MAKVNISFDTSSKELTATIDGKQVPNLWSVSISKKYYYDDEKDENEFSFCMMTSDKTKQEEEGYQSMTQIIANQGQEAKDFVDAGAKKYEDNAEFLSLGKTEIKEKKVQDYISKYMNARRKGK